MELVIYTERYDVTDAVQNFMDFYYAINMKHLASDLLEKGLSPEQITAAITKAVKIANSSGVETYKHFMPVFSGIQQQIIQDCKLSDLGYGLVLINAAVNLPVVGEFQVNVLKKYLDCFNHNF